MMLLKLTARYIEASKIGTTGSCLESKFIETSSNSTENPKISLLVKNYAPDSG